MELKTYYGTVIFALEGAKTVLEVVKSAIEAKKSLRGAVLSGAVLRDADLSGAVLNDAVLSGADLSGAVLRDADLSGAVLRGAVLRGAVLSGAVLRDAVLRDADLSGGLDGVPVIAKIHQVIYEAASQPDGLNMGAWHTCDTTHCRAGWVVSKAGAAGKALEWAMGTPAAAAIIYMASDPKLERVPNFYSSNEEALEDMKRLAEQEASNA